MRAAWYLVFISIGVVYGKLDENVVLIPLEAGAEIAAVSLDCVKKMSLEPDIMKRYFAWELEDSEANRQYIFCLENNSGYMDDDGYIVKDKLLQIVGPHKAKIEDVVEKCNKATYSDKYEAVFRRAMCFKENSGLELRVA